MNKRKWFGPNKKEIWQQLSEQIPADYIPKEGFLGTDKVRAYHKKWEILIDTYTVSTGNSSVTYTRIRVPFANQTDFKFQIYRKHFLSGIGKSFGMQDIEVGYRQFDKDFIIQGNDKRKVIGLFENQRMRDLISEQPKILLKIRHDNGWLQKKFPEGLHELYFQVAGVLKDIDRLKGLYELFTAVLDQLCELELAYEDMPDDVY